MASPKATEDVQIGSDSSFPAADIGRELNLSQSEKVEVDPISAKVASSLEIKEQAEITQKKKELEKKDALQTLKSAFIITGVVVAVAGAVFAITKKMKEK